MTEQELRRTARLRALDQNADLDPVSLMQLEEEIYQKLLKEQNEKGQ